MQFLSGINRNLQGILCLLGALMVLTVSDAIIKWLSPVYPLYEITLIKSSIALVLLLIVTQFTGGLSQLKTQRPWLHLLRGMALVVSDAFYFLGLSVMPMATTITLFFCAPLFVCLIAKLFLGETIGFIRWMAIAVGMVGVIVIVRPGNIAFTWNALFPVLSALTYALMIIMTRKLAMSASAGAMSAYILIAFFLVSIVGGVTVGDGRYNLFDEAALQFLFRAWFWPSITVYQLMVICGIATAVGIFLLSQSYRIAHASVVVPFEYASLPLAIIAGYLLWGDLPTLQDYIGSALIIMSGLVVVYFEIRVSRKIGIVKTG